MKPFVLLPLMSWIFFATNLSAAPPDQVYADGTRPADIRLSSLKDLNGYFPLQVTESRGAWEDRAAVVRRQILVANGLWPMPLRPDVQPILHGRVERENYTVEKVYFESYPGFYVTGNLYRPRGKTGPFPAVLSPHGHFADGRFHDQGEDAVRREIFDGAERFERGGRHPLQARCVQLARMGCIVFHYDMVGYADSKQISYEVAHRHSSPRPELERPSGWGYYTAQAEMRLQNIMGLQTFNSLRAVDFIVGLEDVDPQRLAVTGASGGGTQTMILAALEPRIAVSFPAVMVSTAMQGGCTCENACCLRVDTGNVEFAALFAPKPMGLNAADDWTVELSTKGLPELEAIYALYQAKANVAGYPLVQFPHNYNAVSRGKMYHWLNRHLQLGWEEPVLERDYEPLQREEMSVWNKSHPEPPSGVRFETSFLEQLDRQSHQQLEALATASPQEHRQLVREALAAIVAPAPWTAAIERENLAKEDRGDYWLFRDKLRTPRGSEIPLVFLHPKKWNGNVVVWADGEGKSHLFTPQGDLHDDVAATLSRGNSIAAPDLLMQGEFLTDSKPLTETRKVANNRDFAGYTFGYNRTLLAEQVSDLLDVVRFIREDDHGTRSIEIRGTGGATPHAVLATLLAEDRIQVLSIEKPSFRFRDVKGWRDPYFLPGALKYGDLPAMLAACSARIVPLPAAETR